MDNTGAIVLDRRKVSVNCRGLILILNLQSLWCYAV